MTASKKVGMGLIGAGGGVIVLSLVTDIVRAGGTPGLGGIQVLGVVCGCVISAAGTIIIVKASDLWRKIYPNHLITIIIAGFGVLYFLWGEIIGPGFDGYAQQVQNFDMLFAIGIGAYRLQRILPVAIIHYGLRLFQLPLELLNIVRAFQLYNLFLLTLAAHVWGLITNELKLSHKGKWLAFSGLFVNYAILKNYFFYPVLTDHTAFALGVLMLYFFVANKPWGVLMVSVIGAFAWPSILPVGLLLYIFPHKSDAVWNPAPYRLSILLGVIVSMGILYVTVNNYFINGRLPSVGGVYHPGILLTILIVLVCIFGTTQTLLNDSRFYSVRQLFRAFSLKNLALGAGAVLVVQSIIVYLSDPERSSDMMQLLANLLLISISKPGLFLVAHMVYFGPVLLLTIFWWQPFCRIVRKYGVGLTLFILASALFAVINAESRQLINAFPFFIAFTVKASESVSLKSADYWWIGGICFLYSKAWLIMNLTDVSFPDPPPLDFPWQYYLMNFGPWMSWQMYVVQGTIILLTALLFYALFSKNSISKNSVTEAQNNVN